MKNKKITSIRNVMLKLLVHFTSIFSMLAILDTLVGSLTGSFSMNLWSWGVIICFSFGLSVIMYFVYKINKISVLVQAIITYSIVTFSTYVQGFLIRIFSKEHIYSFLISLGISLIGLVLLCVLLIFKNKKADDDLNESLTKFKERER